MQTRRQWLQAYPRPKSPVNLEILLQQEQRTAAELLSEVTPLYSQLTVANQASNAAQAATLNADIARIKAAQNTAAKNIAQLTAEIARAVKCPFHQLGLHYHRNRPEDLYMCESGPHFLFWTMKDGKPALVPVPTLLLPGLDFPMTEGTKISRAEWLSLNQPRVSAPCPDCKKPLSMQAPDVFACAATGERFLWTKTLQGPGFVPMEPNALPPALESPID